MPEGAVQKTDRPTISVTGADWAWDAASGSAFLFNLHALPPLLVLMADEFDHLRAVRHNLLLDSEGKGLRVRLRIVESELDVQSSEVHAPEPLGHPRSVGIRAAPGIEPSIVVEIIRLDHERVALPSSDGVTVPIRLRLTLRGRFRPSV